MPSLRQAQPHAVAARIINRCVETNKPITCDELQRAMLACEIEAYAVLHRHLTGMTFGVLQTEPVAPEIFSTYHDTLNAPIRKPKAGMGYTLMLSERDMIDSVCDRICASAQGSLMAWYMCEIHPALKDKSNIRPTHAEQMAKEDRLFGKQRT